MTTNGRKQVLLLGLDHRLLWQLTRTLATLEDRLSIDCVKDPADAKEICDREPVHGIVVDGWDRAREAAYFMGGEMSFERGPWKWVILVDSLPLEAPSDGRLSASAVFLEKPFNPKAFPGFLMAFLEGKAPEGAKRVAPPSRREEILPVVPGERYEAPRAEEGGRAGEGAGFGGEETPAGEQDRAFFDLLERGFARLADKDWEGARAAWWEALRIRPHDRRLQANLRRLESMIEENLRKK